MPESRKFSDIVDAVIALTPNERAHDRLVARLARLRIDSWFQPPESLVPWGRLVLILNEEIGEPREGWQIAIAGAVRGRP